MSLLKKGIIGNDGVRGSGKEFSGNVVHNKSFDDVRSKEKLSKDETSDDDMDFMTPEEKRMAIRKMKTGKKKSFNKSVPMGRTYDQPLPMPMLSSGMPDWEGPDLMNYVLMNINNEKSSLHGRSVVLQRMANGLYRIATESYTKHPEDRDKDIAKLRKEKQANDAKKKPVASKKNLKKATIDPRNPGPLGRNNRPAVDPRQSMMAVHQLLTSVAQQGSNLNGAVGQYANGGGTIGGIPVRDLMRRLPTTVLNRLKSGDMNPVQLHGAMQGVVASMKTSKNPNPTFTGTDQNEFRRLQSLNGSRPTQSPVAASAAGATPSPNKVGGQRSSIPVASPGDRENAQRPAPTRPAAPVARIGATPPPAMSASPSRPSSPQPSLQRSMANPFGTKLSFATEEILSMMNNEVSSTSDDIDFLVKSYGKNTVNKALNIAQSKLSGR